MEAVTQLLNTPPTVGFDEPFGMLQACHGRVARSLDLLGRLGAYLAEQGGDDAQGQARDAAADVQRYFDLAAPLHHQDEELHVLPALRAAGQRALADQLQAEHRQMEALWPAVRADLQAVQAGHAPAGTALVAARRRWADFAEVYTSHIAAEETQAYPSAQTTLEPPVQAAMGREMAQRRGVRYPEVGP